MDKLKEILLPKKYKNNEESKSTSNNNKKNSNGKLETDALPVDVDDNNISVNNTPTVSTELNESAIRELSDPNYNSLELTTPDAGNMQLMNPSSSDLAVHNSAEVSPFSPSTQNTMNVNNAQQQIVIQLSNATNTHFGSVYNFNLKEKTTPDVEKRETPRKKTYTIVAMMKSQEEPSTEMLSVLSTHLGKGWKEVMRRLGQSDGQIDQAIVDHQMHGNIREVIYQLLLQWIQAADDGVATVGRITSILWELDHRDCVHRMKLVWKEETKQKISS